MKTKIKELNSKSNSFIKIRTKKTHQNKNKSNRKKILKIKA